MRKITGLIIMLCVLMNVTACDTGKNEESVSEIASQTTSALLSEKNSNAETTVETEQPEESITEGSTTKESSTEECTTKESTTEESETETVPFVKEKHILEIGRKTLYEYEWWDEFYDPLVQCEYSAILLGSEDAKLYPELAAVLTNIAAAQERNIKEEHNMLTELAKEKLSYGADGVHWTLDYNGVTIYFTEGEIADPGFGAMNVTVTFAEHPELFNKKYTDVPEAYIVAIPMKSAFYTDLNGDGSCEELIVSDSYHEENNYYATMDIYTTEASYTESLWAYTCEPYYVKTADDKHYLYFFAELETQMYLHVYDLTGGRISKVGEANVTPFYSDEISAVLTDPNKMHFYNPDGGFDGSVWGEDDFYSVGTDGMPAQG